MERGELFHGNSDPLLGRDVNLQKEHTKHPGADSLELHDRGRLQHQRIGQARDEARKHQELDRCTAR